MWTLPLNSSEGRASDTVEYPLSELGYAFSISSRHRSLTESEESVIIAHILREFRSPTSNSPAFAAYISGLEMLFSMKVAIFSNRTRMGVSLAVEVSLDFTNQLHGGDVALEERPQGVVALDFGKQFTDVRFEAVFVSLIDRLGLLCPG